MKLYVLIQSCEEGYYQDTIQGIYQSKADAKQALAEAKANEPEDGDYGCVMDVSWHLATHSLIPGSSK